MYLKRDTRRPRRATTRKRKIFNTALEYVVGRELLDRNPIPALKWRSPRTVIAVDAGES
jgi:hypothetical protein